MQFFTIYYRNESSKCTVLPEVHHVNESSILGEQYNNNIYSETEREREKNCSFYDNTTDSHRAPKRSVNRSNYPALCCSSILVKQQYTLVVKKDHIENLKLGFWVLEVLLAMKKGIFWLYLFDVFSKYLGVSKTL